MNKPIDDTNEQKVALAFTGQSAIFDQLYASNEIVSYKRERVWQLLSLGLSARRTTMLDGCDHEDGCQDT